MGASSIFEIGNETINTINVKSSSSLPCSLLVFSPTTKGSHPVLLFFHGFMLQPSWYKSLLQHISSHRCIIVAPQEVKSVRKIAEWLINNLESVLPEKVQPDLEKVAISGHSKGGNMAFAVAFDSSMPLKFSALLGIDPVAGASPSCLRPPYVLEYIPRIFNQSIPVAVVGAGLSNQSTCCLLPSGAPNGVNHAEFFNESKPPCYYFLAKDYGHADMLEAEGIMAILIRILMKSGKGSKDSMIRAVGGIVVAFLKAYLEGQIDDLNDIVKSPNLAPITLDPVISIKD
ncbi:chlorophyllase-2-like isoform X2 [Solanum verrucosum]|uniref:chlorophyllase-2-like isoform X2 n=1 Tax=Solanum verrucosum TaxID=315347 RepID=UPI0020D01494|nr:chlorophyllase-2-like isoform X2 [Solanum verrucosum]